MAIERREVYPVPRFPRIDSNGHLIEQPASRMTWPEEVEVWVAPLGTPLPTDLDEPSRADGWQLLGKTAQNGCEAFHDGWGRYEVSATCSHVSGRLAAPWRAPDGPPDLLGFAVVLRTVWDQATLEWQFPRAFLNAPPVRRIDDDSYRIEFVPLQDGPGPVWVILSNAEADH